MKVLKYDEVAGVIHDGDSVIITGFSRSGMATYVYSAIEESFNKTGHPRDLYFNCSALGGTGELGTYVDHFGPRGLIRGIRASHVVLAPRIKEQVDNSIIPGHMVPLGTMCQIVRDMSAGKPGTITKVGLGTFLDPRLEGGRMNDITEDDICSLIEIDGEEWLFYPKFHIDVALVRGTYSDTKGNISMEHEPTYTDALNMAQAAKHDGGIVIAQVEEIVPVEQLNARDIQIPGVMVDYVITAPKEHQGQTAEIYYDPVLCQEERQDLAKIPPRHLDIRKILARRAAMEIREGDVVNLGYGIPEVCADVAAEEGISDRYTLTCECGLLGGVPGSGPDFGTTRNAEFVIDTPRMMDWYDGGGLDIAVLGFGEIDAAGNVNVTKLGGNVGTGGFMNIVTGTKRLVFCGAFTSGGLKVRADNGRLEILEEGRTKKIVSSVQQISFSSRVAKESGHSVTYVTERAVFELRDEGPVLTEIAPGIDLKTQVLDLIDFDVAVADDLKQMDARIFTDRTMGL